KLTTCKQTQRKEPASRQRSEGGRVTSRMLRHAGLRAESIGVLNDKCVFDDLHGAVASAVVLQLEGSGFLCRGNI
ncbi:jg4319, partial [Pararge aegeria aegeria]